MVMGVFSLRAEFRKESCMFCAGLSISPISLLLLLRVRCAHAFLQLRWPGIAQRRGVPTGSDLYRNPRQVLKTYWENYFVQYGLRRDFSTLLCFFLGTIARQTGL